MYVWRARYPSSLADALARLTGPHTNSDYVSSLAVEQQQSAANLPRPPFADLEFSRLVNRDDKGSHDFTLN